MVVLLFAFGLSVAVRYPQLGRPLSEHHEFCTALTLIILHNWAEDGIAAHQGSPPVNFGGLADRHIPWMTMAEAERDGRFYYLSHPPFAFVFPHMLFQVLGVPPTPFGLQLFALFFHFTTTLCLYRLVKGALSEGGSSSHAPMVAAVLYLFMPSPLWFHSNAYMADIFVHCMWVFHLVVAQRTFQGPSSGWRIMALYGITLALTVYTSWLGVFVAAASMLLLFWQRSLSPPSRRFVLLGVTVAAILLPLAAMVWAYSSTVGLDDLLAYLAGRLGQRSSLGVFKDSTATSFQYVLSNYRTGYLPVLLLLAAAFVAAWYRGAGFWPKGDSLKLFVLLTTIPVLMELAVLLEYAGHDFVALKGGVFLCGSAAILLERSIQGLRGAGHLRLVSVSLAGVLGVFYFLRQNPYPDGSIAQYGQAQEAGLTIARTAAPDEVVFTMGFEAEPQVVWYAKRTPLRVHSLEEATTFLRRHGYAAGIVFRKGPVGLEGERINAVNED